MVENENKLLELLESFYKNNDYVSIINLINENEDIINTKYYDICKYKIDAMFNLEKYIDALLIIENELKMPYIPQDFETYLHKIKKQIENILKDKNRKIITKDDLYSIDKFDDNTLINIIPNLKDFNVNDLVLKFQNIFDNENINDLTKTLLIAALQDIKLDYEFFVYKNDTKIKFNPKNLSDYDKNNVFLYIENCFKYINDISINIVAMSREICLKYVLSLYPYAFENQELDLIICASIIYALDSIEAPLENKKYQEIYHQNEDKIERIITKIDKLF